VILDKRWAHLRDGAFILIDKEQPIQPFADGPIRETRLWDATVDLLQQATHGGR
jgi:hypothetical protein